MTRRIGFFVCECGPNIADAIDIDEVLNAIDPIEDVVLSARFKLMCSGEGKEFLKVNIETEKLTHVVVAACSPKQHELTFMEVCEEAKLNPFLFQLVNIREQVAWVTKDKAEATKKAIRLSKAAIRRVRYHDPLFKTELAANPDVLVIGGGVAGLTASLRLASSDRQVRLVERAPRLGGHVSGYEALFPHMESGREMVEGLVQRVSECDHIHVYTSSEVSAIVGFFGNFEVVVSQHPEGPEEEDDTGEEGPEEGSSGEEGPQGAAASTKAEIGQEEIEFRVGAVVVATGAELLQGKPLEDLGHGSVEGVVTSSELEAMLASGSLTIGGGKSGGSIAFVNCVGRDDVGYCSEVCCMYSSKLARLLLERLSGAKAHLVYRDLCVPGREQEAFVREAEAAGVRLVRATSVDVKAAKGGVVLTHSCDGGKAEKLEVDTVVLAPAMVPSKGTEALAEMLNISMDRSGFLLEAHEKLDPMATGIDGVYLAGCSSGPRSVRDAIVQAEAVSGRILSSLVPGRTIEPETRVSHILETLCKGCQTCLEVCCYGAITYDPVKEVSTINAAICRGCGNCVAACPSSAITLYHFTYRQLYQEIEEAIR